ncbi:MAG: cysteine--1-D-myo-inosityl 2-amino-2-deoxy-alpha-D-glucopyranoside ligase [Actinobacteria bacterium]|nr:cysteine--1-D-myo-inosityl 2-amino-2-deoxy-alpha-D-glucopyranoside ligase [Actinomycetota bacterium]
MQPWPNLEVPNLDFVAPAPNIYDSASETKQTLAVDREVKIYVCGITPYDATHMGHAATYVAFDTLIRLWRAAGAEVIYAQNITDVDDPLIERAQQTGRDWQEIAVEQTELFKQDMIALRVIPPQHYIGAVESIPLVVDQIEQLRTADCVYDIDGDLYYKINNTQMLGAIAHLSRHDMIDLFSQRGGDPHKDGKHDPLDPLLWRHERPNDPAWDTELGSGRPGWHIECAAIAVHYLGETIDVQGGGSDLKFPHHEMSAAHAQSATGVTPFARTFMHTGMVWLDGHKMSKSLGNLVFVSKLTASGVDPMAIRLAILAHSYCEEWEWTDAGLEEATARLDLWRSAMAIGGAPNDYAQRIADALANDLHTPTALALVDEWANRVLSGVVDDSSDSSNRHQMAQVIDALLGIK